MFHSTRDYLNYYKRKLERNKTDETTVVHIIEKLEKTDFPVNDLLNSGIYKLFRIRGKSGGSNNIFFPLYNKWKMLVLAAENDKIKMVQNSIPVQNRVSDPLENDVNDSFNAQPMDIQNGSPQTKSNTEGNRQTKSNTKGSPQVLINHANSSSCDISRANPAYKECNKRTNKEHQLKQTLIESPERPRSKKFKHSVPEPKNLFISDSKSVSLKESSSSHQSN